MEKSFQTPLKFDPISNNSNFWWGKEKILFFFRKVWLIRWTQTNIFRRLSVTLIYSSGLSRSDKMLPRSPWSLGTCRTSSPANVANRFLRVGTVDMLPELYGAVAPRRNSKKSSRWTQWWRCTQAVNIELNVAKEWRRNNQKLQDSGFCSQDSTWVGPACISRQALEKTLQLNGKVSHLRLHSVSSPSGFIYTAQSLRSGAAAQRSFFTARTTHCVFILRKGSNSQSHINN